MNKIIIPVIVGTLVLSIGLSLDVWAPEEAEAMFQKKSKLKADGIIGPMTAALSLTSAANENFPSAPSGACTISDTSDGVTISCTDGSETTVINLSQKQLDKINDLLDSIEKEIAEVQFKETDWNFLRR